MALLTKLFWPTLANEVHRVCIFIQKHQQTLILVITTLDPSVEADVVAAFAALNAACALFISVMAVVDPNWKPS